jgi:ElaB/YqjD/DUF883 family membrane-anchored ribosome-binding protein
MAGTVQNKTSDIQERMADMADDVHEMADQAMEMAGEGIKQVRDSVRNSMRSARQGMGRLEKSFEDTVAQRPLLSVGTAFGIGMGIVFGMWALDCFMNRDR